MLCSRVIFSIIIFLLFSFSANSQKVALVFSGGGAKGIAHVGVLKALEEHNIPVDFVVGTSMGGVIAGCYAAGLSAKDIESIMTSEEFNRWVNGDFETGFNYFYSKDDDNSSFLNIKLSLDSTFHATVSSSLASDLSLNFALSETFAQPAAKAKYNFDSLFVPTRLIAADIFTQSEVPIDSGSLSSAVRTTLSVPFFYKPIKFNGRYLFDGGIYNNFPVDVAQREFNPDVIIGVNVSSKIFNDYPYNNDEGLLNNSLLFMLLDKSNPESITETGIYLEPNLKGFTAFDFVKAQALIDSGYSETIKNIEKIKSKIERRSDSEVLEKKRKEFTSGYKPLIFSDINFHGFNSKQRKYIKHIFRFKEGKLLSLNDIKKGYFRLVSEQYFRTIYPDITYQEESNSYQLEMYGRPESNLNVEIGGVIATRNVSQIYLGVEHYYFNNYLLKNSLSFYTGSFYKSAQLKTRINLPALGQFYIESDLIYNNWDYIGEEDIIIPDKEITLLNRTDRKYGLNIGFPISDKFKAVLNGAWINNDDQFSNIRNFSTADTLDLSMINGWRTGVEFTRNNLNRKQYASQGSSYMLSLDYFKVDERYEPGSTSAISERQKAEREWIRAKFTFEQYFLKGWYSTGYYLSGNFSSQSFFTNYMSTIINAPGFNAMQDSESLLLQNFKAHNYLTVGLRNVFSIKKNLDFRLEAYIFKPFDVIEQNNDQGAFYNDDLTQAFLAATGGFVLHSPVGPISLSANYYDDSETKFGVLMHVGYLLFQDRSID